MMTKMKNSKIIFSITLAVTAMAFVLAFDPSSLPKGSSKLDPGSDFVQDLLKTVKDEIMNRDKKYAPGIMDQIIKAYQLPSSKPNMRLFRLNFILKTYHPEHPEIKMYRMLFCEAEIATYFPIKLANQLLSLSCSKENDQDQDQDETRFTGERE